MIAKSIQLQKEILNDQISPAMKLNQKRAGLVDCVKMRVTKKNRKLWVGSHYDTRVLGWFQQSH